MVCLWASGWMGACGPAGKACRHGPGSPLSWHHCQVKQQVVLSCEGAVTSGVEGFYDFVHQAVPNSWIHVCRLGCCNAKFLSTGVPLILFPLSLPVDPGAGDDKWSGFFDGFDGRVGPD